MDSTPHGDGPITLAPRPWVALGVLALAAGALALPPLGSLAPWVALPVGLFGLFLLLQSALLRLRFCDDALLVLRSEREIRRFPYEEWLGWKLFWPPLPVLFYFRERRSLHLLPVLFDATGLREQLERRLTAQGPLPPQ